MGYDHLMDRVFEVNSYVTAFLAFGYDLHRVFSFVWTVILFDVNTVNVAELFNLRGCSYMLL